MNNFNENEFLELCRRFNTKPFCEDISIQYTNNSFFNKMKKAIEKDRRGEVVFCVIRPDGKIITITCEEYPSGIFRIPTGGIGHNEDIVEALFRETKEELGLEVEIKEFAGALKIRIINENDSVMFYSYIFILKEIGGVLLKDAIDDEISEVKEVNLDGLEEIAKSLKNIVGKWSDWGKFRFETTNAVFRYLKRRGY